MPENNTITFSDNDTFDNSLIEVVGGEAQLKVGGGTSPQVYTDPQDSGTGKTFNGSLVEFSGGNAELKLIDNPGQTFVQDFTSSTGFTFDAGKTEFAAGLMEQKDASPANSTSWATFTSSIDLTASPGGGVLTGTATGGASVSGGKLDLKNKGGNAFVDYAGSGNVDFGQTFAIKFKFTPDYTGNPANSQILFTAYEVANPNDNKVQMWIDAGGAINLDIRDSSGVGIVSGGLAVYSATSGVEVEFELDCDVTAGATRVFLDGVQQGATQLGTGVRTSTIDRLRLGGSSSGTFAPDFELDDVILFDAVEHTAGYSPGYTLNETIYLEDLITFPTFTYSDAGALQAFSGFTTNQTGGQQFNIAGQYWNGSAWAASDDTLGQMNNVATIATNIAALGATDTVVIKSRWTASNNQQDIDDLSVTYTGQNYTTTDPSVLYDVNNFSVIIPFTLDLTSFVETATVPGSDAIKYVISNDGGSTFLWFSGGWVTSDGTFAQSNSASEIETNIATFPNSTQILLKFFLSSDDGSTTPQLDLITIGYDINQYATSNPTIETASSAIFKDTLDFVEEATKPSGSEIKYIFKDGDDLIYFDTSNFVPSDGTYAQANTAAEIQTNKHLIRFEDEVKLIVFLHSDDGTETPVL